MNPSLKRIIFTACLFGLLGNFAAKADGWKECKMHWQDIEWLGLDMSERLTQSLKYHKENQVMQFEGINLDAHVMGVNNQFFDNDETRIRVSLWELDDGYRMTYVWHDMTRGISTQVQGETVFVPSTILVANYFEGRLDCS